MSDPAYAGPGVPYWLSNFGVNRVPFIKQAAPPISELDRGILYELVDGGIYWNGVRLDGGGGSGDVSSSTDPSRDLAAVVYDGITGKIIKETNLEIDSSSDAILKLNQHYPGDTTYRFITSDIDMSTTSVGYNSGPVSTSLSDASTFIGAKAGELGTSLSECTFVGVQAGGGTQTDSTNTALGYQAFGFAVGSNNTAVGSRALWKSTTPFNAAFGDKSQNQIDTADGPGVIPNSSFGAYSMQNLQKGMGNNAFGWRALEGGICVGDGAQFNNMFGCFNGLTATDGFDYNCCFGNSCLNSAPTAKGNTCFGNGAGGSFINGTESFNILMGNGTGKNNDNRTIRIGADSDSLATGVAQPLDCYIQGIHNRSAAAAISRKLVAVASDGKLYGMDQAAANPICNGYFQDYTSLYVVPIVSTNVAVPVAPTLTFNSFGTGYFSNSAAGIITYNGVDTINAKITIQISARLTGGTNENFDLMIYKSGVLVPGSTARVNVAALATFSTLSSIVPNLSTSGTIQVWCANATGTQVLAIGNINITAEVLY